MRLLYTGERFAALRARVCGVVADSCPGTITLGVMARVLSVTFPAAWQRLLLRAALAAALAAEFAVARYIAAGLRPRASAAALRGWGVAGVVLASVVAALSVRSHSREYNAAFRSAPARWRELYVFCDDDPFVDAADTAATAAARSAQGVDVSSLRLPSSAHVSHLLRHPAAYEAAIVAFVGRIDAPASPAARGAAE